jgi:anti-anti-sigma factor
VTESPFSYDLSADERTLTLHGDLDEGASVQLRELLSGLAERGTQMRLDLNFVVFLPSSAIGVLAAARGAISSNGGSLTFVAAPGTIAQRVLTICSLPFDES